MPPAPRSLRPAGDRTYSRASPVAVAMLQRGRRRPTVGRRQADPPGTAPPYGVRLDPTGATACTTRWGPAEPGYLQTDPACIRTPPHKRPGAPTGERKGHRNTTVSGDTGSTGRSLRHGAEPDRRVRLHAGVHAAQVAAGLERIGFEIVSQVIWDKGRSRSAILVTTGVTSRAGFIAGPGRRQVPG